MHVNIACESRPIIKVQLGAELQTGSSEEMVKKDGDDDLEHYDIHDQDKRVCRIVIA